MNFAVIGTGKIGQYHIRDFIKSGYILTGIVNSTIESSQKNILKFNEQYEMNVKAYNNIDELIENETLSLIVISSNTETHINYINMCIDNNINFYCEKPFIFNIENDNTKICNDIITSCNSKNINFNVNTQWVYGISQIKNYIPSKLEYISLYMEHFKTPDNIDFYTENISHMNSIIIFLLGCHTIMNLKMCDQNTIKLIEFDYNNVHIIYKLNHNNKPHNKKIEYQFNDFMFERYVDEQYEQFFIMNNDTDNKIAFNDPFYLAIKNFTNNTSLITNEHIYYNVKMMDNIIKQ